MRGNWYLNGCDYLMLSFDYELRRRGFAGNSCQIVLDLADAIAPERVQSRFDAIRRHFPVLSARRAGFLSPRWKLPQRPALACQVRVHADEPGLTQRVFNQPLAADRGELLRLDLAHLRDRGSRLIFTWAHALMDAPAAEHFLALMGDETLPWPSATPPGRRPVRAPFFRRLKLAQRNIRQLEDFCKAAPRTLGTRYAEASAQLAYQVEKFSEQETQRVRANGMRHCGVLGEAQYHAAVVMTELHRLHQRLGCASPSYVLPVPVGLRPKGSMEPLISNQVGMLMLQFLPEHLDSVAHAVAALKAQTQAALRAGLLDSGLMLSEISRVLPLPIYTAVMKSGLRGEICSYYYGDTALVNPRLTRFLDAAILDLSHAAAVTPSPGIGSIFYHFRGLLRVTVMHASTVLNAAEAGQFAAGLRARLLDP